MKTPSESQKKQRSLREKIIGLGEHSIQKSYYPQLRNQLKALEEHKQHLEQQSDVLSKMIEELQAARKTAEESEGRLRLLLESSEDIIFMQDLEGRYLYYNGPSKYGLHPDQIIGKTPFDFFDHETASRMMATLKHVISTGERITLENQVVWQGETLWFLDETNPVRDEQGRIMAISGISRNITERKWTEEQIRKLNAELEQRVQQRTAELEAANKELTSFAYIVSHDLKAPLRGISRLAHWLVEDYADAFDEKGKDMVELLIGRVKRMDNLIDGILEYSRVGRIASKDEEVDLDRIVRDVIDSIAPPEHIWILIENELPVIISDRIRIAQVFQNLLSNAVEYMDKPDGKITIGCVDEGSYWAFSVADNGPGIDPKYHEKIFQIFQTLTPRDIRESTGIGLALVKKIVELYGGKIWVESTVGQGSAFYFTLPKRRHL